MNVFGIGLPEMAVIAAIGLLVFGPKRLPELGKTLGKTLRGFQSASQEFEKEFRQAVSPEVESASSDAGSLVQGSTSSQPLTQTTAPSLMVSPDSSANAPAEPVAVSTVADPTAIDSTLIAAPAPAVGEGAVS